MGQRCFDGSEWGRGPGCQRLETRSLTRSPYLGILPTMRQAQRLAREEAGTILRHCLEEGEVIPGSHFRQELAAEGLGIEDAYGVLRHGRIYDEPEFAIKHGNWRYKVEGHEPDGQWLCIVFAIEEVDSVFLITVNSVNHRRKR